MAAKGPSAKYAGKPDMIRHHHPVASKLLLASFIFPWLVIAGQQYYIQTQDTEDSFCETASIIPDRFMCTDIRRCDEFAYWVSSAGNGMNAQVRARCGPVTNEVTMTIPYETYSPSDETIAQIRAEIGDIKSWQRNKVIQQAVAEMGGPD